MPTIEELINDNMKKNLKKVANNFVGATPNLNSSLGINAFIGGSNLDGDPMPVVSEPTPVTSGIAAGEVDPNDPSKLDSFYSKNQNVITGVVSSIGGLLGLSKPATTTTGAPLPAPAKSGMPTWAWVLIAIVVAVIIFFVVKSMKK